MILQMLEEKGFFVMNRWKNRQRLKQQRLLREEDDREFMQELARAKQNLQIARENFNATTDDELMEYYIYKIKAEETKLNYYLSRAKKESRVCFGDIASTFRAEHGGGCM